jgi:hypothetical protein
MIDVKDTIFGQYSFSPTIKDLCFGLSAILDRSKDISTFLSAVLNIDTAHGWGLDVWGRIVGVSRFFAINIPTTYFGMYSNTEGISPELKGFDQAPFFNGSAPADTYKLSDSAYRKLILFKAASNIIYCDVLSINKFLRLLFDNKKCYVLNTGSMAIRYNFHFSVDKYLKAMILQSGVLPSPSGVLVNYFFVPQKYFGFSDAGQPNNAYGFDQAPLYRG